MSGLDPEELGRQRHELSEALLQVREQMTPIFDTADGMRADLDKRGWSPTASEQVALVWLSNAVQSVLRGGT